MLTAEHVLSVEMLVAGYPFAFVEFFHLNHRPKRIQVNFETGKEEVVTPRAMTTPQLEAMVENLLVAEEAKRKGEINDVLAAYINLADYFEDEGDFDTAISFHKSCWELASSAGKAEAEGYANCRLGMCYERIGNVDAAVGYYEQYHLLSTQPEAVKDACSHLVKCYWIQAERAETRGMYDVAIEHYKACMSKAAEGGDTAAEGETNYRIGLTCEQLGQTLESIEFFKSYLDVCRRTGNAVAEGTACFALAKAYQKLDDLDTAVYYLEIYIELAEKTNQPSALSEAACSLGIIFNQQGEYEKAVTYFDKNFDMALKIGDPLAIDNARVLLGISRGHECMSEYMHLVDMSDPALLLWKTTFNAKLAFGKDLGAKAADHLASADSASAAAHAATLALQQSVALAEAEAEAEVEVHTKPEPGVQAAAGAVCGLWAPVAVSTAVGAASIRASGCQQVAGGLMAFATAMVASMTLALYRIYTLMHPPTSALVSLPVARTLMARINDLLLACLAATGAASLYALGLIILGVYKPCSSAALFWLVVQVVGWGVYGPASMAGIYFISSRLAERSQLARYADRTVIWTLPCVLILAGLAFLAAFITLLVAFFIGSAVYI
ncbi:uncharacterized protein AMSG_12291 [Thecamonas trahens ATCC 50062]|uniref:Tetratricopeptide repeat protein 29 n=1 Tax=Thecamonas trahens ATCC 50062 TaxID=461836 RepID=A0A0L0DNI0_THETB|nr:hypothetical protein AMSG_12291 [Thecamonas trahens ATCC 50062]KNC53872.1 hypothetical protein AMSG_12291 [Thecamonas trahens ATCC 50062]|eukprot:XP_013754284.1 hypothetical protein AMSG_12291 [Thecamonas trahens ATCC 50062]